MVREEHRFIYTVSTMVGIVTSACFCIEGLHRICYNSVQMFEPFRDQNPDFFGMISLSWFFMQDFQKLIGSVHCLIVTCKGAYKQQALTNSRTRKVDQKFLKEQFMTTSGRWCMHLNNFSETKITKLFFFLFCCNLRFFWIFENFVNKFSHEKALNQMN